MIIVIRVNTVKATSKGALKIEHCLITKNRTLPLQLLLLLDHIPVYQKKAFYWRYFTYTNPKLSANVCATKPARMATREFPSTALLKMFPRDSWSNPLWKKVKNKIKNQEHYISIKHSFYLKVFKATDPSTIHLSDVFTCKLFRFRHYMYI